MTSINSDAKPPVTGEFGNSEGKITINYDMALARKSMALAADENKTRNVDLKDYEIIGK